MIFFHSLTHTRTHARVHTIICHHNHHQHRDSLSRRLQDRYIIMIFFQSKKSLLSVFFHWYLPGFQHDDDDEHLFLLLYDPNLYIFIYKLIDWFTYSIHIWLYLNIFWHIKFFFILFYVCKATREYSSFKKKHNIICFTHTWFFFCKLPITTTTIWERNTDSSVIKFWKFLFHFSEKFFFTWISSQVKPMFLCFIFFVVHSLMMTIMSVIIFLRIFLYFWKKK